jgi:hypothetical protein
MHSCAERGEDSLSIGVVSFVVVRVIFELASMAGDDFEF